MDITSLDIVQLKALAYELVVNIKQNENNLEKVEGELQRKLSEEAAQKVAENEEAAKQHEATVAAEKAKES